MARLYRNYLGLSLIVITLLSACATTDKPTDFASALAQTTYEITAAANAIADAADAGLISRESRDYQTVKQAFLTASTYLDLAWSYYGEGNYFDAANARQAALAAYLPIREHLLRLQEAQ